jgi:anti-anti-sigma regulatory factor
MNITATQVQGRVPVTVLAVDGSLDGSNFQELIAAGERVYTQGTRYVLVDLGQVPYMSSAGLVALHSIALLMSGQPMPDFENGWSAFHAVGQKQGKQGYVKLLNPQPKVDRVLRMAGMEEFFEIHSDQATAVAAF